MPKEEFYREWRETYRPKKIKCLLMAESPPKSEDVRFFYNPCQEKWDFLFRSVMEVVFPDFKTGYKKGQKCKYLKMFKERGFYLIDAVDSPINDKSQGKRNKKLEKI